MAAPRTSSHILAALIAASVSFAAAQVSPQESPNGPVTETDSLRAEIARLRQQNQTLAASVIDAKKGEAQAAEQLAQIKQRLAALGKNLLDGGNDRLVQAAADIQVLQERLTATEKTALNLSAATQDFARQAIVADSSTRLKLEVAIRELDAALGLRHKPRPDIKTGSTQRAQVVSIDSESGLLVINSGETQNLRIGMTYSLQRGDATYGKAIIADTRKNIAGAFVEQLNSPDETVRIGDTLLLETEAR